MKIDTLEIELTAEDVSRIIEELAKENSSAAARCENCRHYDGKNCKEDFNQNDCFYNTLLSICKECKTMIAEKQKEQEYEE